MDTLIKNCQLVNLKNESCEKVSIFVVDGKIEKIENSQTINSDDFLTIDLNGKYILPGLWDVHTHIGDLIPDPDNLLETETLPEYIKTNVKSKDKEFENLIPENILAEQKLEKETKEKRKKEHFFHGKIKFNT